MKHEYKHEMDHIHNVDVLALMLKSQSNDEWAPTPTLLQKSPNQEKKP